MLDGGGSRDGRLRNVATVGGTGQVQKASLDVGRGEGLNAIFMHRQDAYVVSGFFSGCWK